MISAVNKIFAIIGKRGRFIALLALRAPFDIAFTIVNAMFLQNAFNAVEQNDSAGLLRVCIVFGIASLGLFLYNGTIWSIYSPFTTRLEEKLRIRLFEKIASFPYNRIEKTTQGEWVTRLNTDVEAPFSRNFTFPHVVCAIVSITASAGILWRINPVILGWVMLFIIPHILVSHFFIARAMLRLNEKSLDAIAVNTGEMTALITCADAAALYDGQDYLMKRFEDSSKKLFGANMKIHEKNAFSAGVVPLFALSGYLILLFVSSRWIASGYFTFGDLSAAFQYRGGVLKSSLMLISCIITIQASMASIRRFNETMDERS